MRELCDFQLQLNEGEDLPFEGGASLLPSFVDRAGRIQYELRRAKATAVAGSALANDNTSSSSSSSRSRCPRRYLDACLYRNTRGLRCSLLLNPCLIASYVCNSRVLD